MPTYTDPVILDSTGQDIVTQLQGIAAALPGGSSKADKTDLASIQATGTTNLTGATITAGTYFYLNGTLVQAKTDIASGATFTADTNYTVVTAGALNELKIAFDVIHTATATAPTSVGSGGRVYKKITVPSGKRCYPLSFSVLHKIQNLLYSYGCSEIPNEYTCIWDSYEGIRLQFDTSGFVTAFGGQTVTFLYIIV